MVRAVGVVVRDRRRRRLLLFDPLAPPAQLEQLADERETAIVLTCPWHRREAEALADRYGAPFMCRHPTRAIRARSTERSSERRIGCRSVPPHFREWSRTISCSGSRATPRSSP